MSSENYLHDFLEQIPFSVDANQSATQILHFFGTYRFITVFITEHMEVYPDPGKFNPTFPILFLSDTFQLYPPIDA